MRGFLRCVGEEVGVRMPEGIARVACSDLELELLLGRAVDDANGDAIRVLVPEERYRDAIVLALVKLTRRASESGDARLADGRLALEAVVAAHRAEPGERIRHRPATGGAGEGRRRHRVTSFRVGRT